MAYDRLKLPTIMRVLEDDGVPRALIAAIVREWWNTASTYSMGECGSGEISRVRGLPQGDPLSLHILSIVDPASNKTGLETGLTLA